MTDPCQTLLTRGGPVIWAIGALSVITLALILWKLFRLSALGAWSGGRVNGSGHHRLADRQPPRARCRASPPADPCAHASPMPP